MNTDRTAIEKGLFARCFWRICTQLRDANPDSSDALDPIIETFRAIFHRALDDVDDRVFKKRIDRLHRAQRIVLERFENRAIATTLYACVKVMQELIEVRGVLDLAPDGLMRPAFEAMVALIGESDENNALLVRVDRSAAKGARAVVDDLLREGYFRRVVILD